MGVLVRLGSRKALLRDGRWVCADTRLEPSLNEATDAWFAETGGPALSDPEPERAVAREIARRFGGKVLRYTSPKDAGKSYLWRRQLKLFG